MPIEFEFAELPADAIEVGRIQDAWGIKGWFKVLPHSASPEALFSSKRWYLQPSERGAKTFSGTVLLRVREAKEHADTIVATAQDIDDRTAAEALRGARIFIPRSSFPSAGTDEYYWIDLIGLEVVNRESQPLGRVIGLIDTGPHAVLRVLPPGVDEPPKPDQERLIPFVDAFIDEVSLEAKQIRVDWGLDF